MNQTQNTQFNDNQEVPACPFKWAKMASAAELELYLSRHLGGGPLESAVALKKAIAALNLIYSYMAEGIECQEFSHVYFETKEKAAAFKLEEIQFVFENAENQVSKYVRHFSRAGEWQSFHAYLREQETASKVGSVVIFLHKKSNKQEVLSKALEFRAALIPEQLNRELIEFVTEIFYKNLAQFPIFIVSPTHTLKAILSGVEVVADDE